MAEPTPESLSDEELLALSDARLDASDEEALGDLLERNREGELDPAGRRRLEEVMRAYRASQVRKAQALKIAVDRGLRPQLTWFGCANS